MNNKERIKNLSLLDKTITKDKIADQTITLSKIDPDTVSRLTVSDGSVTTPKIADEAVTTPKLADNSVTTTKINNNAITTEKILDQAVTFDKLDINSVFTPLDHSFTATGDLTYTLPFEPRSKLTLLVFKNGIAVSSNLFNVLDDALTFNAGAITSGDEIYVKDISIFAVATNIITHEVVINITEDNTYPLNINVNSQLDTLAVLNGQVLHPDNYNISGDYVTFDSDIIEFGDIALLKIWIPSSSADMYVSETIYANVEPTDAYDYYFETTIGETSYILSEAPLSKASTMVFVNGVDMSPEDFELYGANLVFNEDAIDTTIVNYVHVRSLLSWNYITKWNTAETFPDNIEEFNTIIDSSHIQLDNTTIVTLPFIPLDKSSFIVILNSLVLHSNNYEFNGYQIIINSGIALEGYSLMIKSLRAFTSITKSEISGLQSNFNLMHDGTNGYFENNYGDLYIDTVHPVDGIEGGCIRSRGKIFNAVWNDYADYWDLKDEVKAYPGLCYADYGNGLELPKKVGDKCVIGIYSDTYGYGMGERENAIPIAVSGFVLAYVDKEYDSGTLLTNNKEGILTKANFYHIMMGRVVGKYIKKNQSKKFNHIIKVDNRSWIKVI